MIYISQDKLVERHYHYIDGGLIKITIIPHTHLKDTPSLKSLSWKVHLDLSPAAVKEGLFRLSLGKSPEEAFPHMDSPTRNSLMHPIAE